MKARYGGFAALLVMAGAAWADATAPALHGISLGMTPDEAKAAAHLPCDTPQYSALLTCKDDGDGSDYRAMFSAGQPSIALSVQRGFCSASAPAQVLAQAERALHVAADHVRPDPNGFTIDLGNDNEAVLNADDGTCQAGGKHYVLLIRSDGLIKMSSDQAIRRVKKALH